MRSLTRYVEHQVKGHSELIGLHRYPEISASNKLRMDQQSKSKLCEQNLQKIKILSVLLLQHSSKLEVETRSLLSQIVAHHVTYCNQIVEELAPIGVRP